MQCRGSMTFWCGSGSADPCLWLMDPDPDPSIFVIDLQVVKKNQIFKTIFSAFYFLKVHLHHFSKRKIKKESQNSRNRDFSYYFCMMIEGSGAGSIPLTNGSGSGRPKNMCIRWIRIRIRIRIRDTAFMNVWLMFSILICKCPLDLKTCCPNNNKNQNVQE